MDISSLLVAEALQDVELAISGIRFVWDTVKNGVLHLLVGPAAFLSLNWMGYGISFANPLQPRVVLYFNSDPGPLGPFLAIFPQLARLGVPDIETGTQFKALSPTPAAHAVLAAAAAAGASLSPGSQLLSVLPAFHKTTSGTLGAFVRDDQTGSVWILGANHVLGFNDDQHPHTVSFQGTPVATTIRLVTILVHGDNPADVALAQYSGPAASVSTPFPGVTLGSKIPVSAPSSTRVVKLGGATGRTVGVLEETLCIQLQMDEPECGISAATFTNQWLVSDAGGVLFADEGDSGSIALVGDNDGNLTPLGMLIGVKDSNDSSKRRTVVTPLQNALDKLNGPGFTVKLI